MYQRRRDIRGPQYTAHDYSISISDVMSALLYVFIVILIIFSFNMGNSENDFRSEYIKAAKERERMEKINEEQNEKLKKLETGIVELHDLAAQLKRDLDQHMAKTAQLLFQLLTDIHRDLQVHENLKVFIDPNHGLLRLPNEILFPSGSAQFAPGGEETLNKLTRVLARHLPCYAGTVDSTQRPASCEDRQWNPGTLDAVFIEGHTDNIPLSRANPHSNNLHLSGMRAIRTFETLLGSEQSEATGGKSDSVLAGLRNQKGQPVFGISGYGERRPVIFYAEPTPDAANRRIDIRFFLVNPKPPAVIPQLFEELDRLTQKLDALK
ncbi:MAG: hypothetical protein HQL99_12560 [Magnetococcales bacterium]|nr:hypothetical protein [Magnetococcales bacterium]